MPKITYNESLTTTKEKRYIFVGSEDANGTEKIVESIPDRYENVLFMIMTSCKGPRCDGQKKDKQKYFSFETCLYNLQQLILQESVSPNGAACVGHSSKPPNPSRRTGRTAQQLCRSCSRLNAWESSWGRASPGALLACLKRGNLKIFIFNAIDFNKDVNKKLPPLLTQSSSILTKVWQCGLLSNSKV